MKAFRSIRLRLLLFSLVVTLFALMAAGAGLVSLFGRHIERRIASELDVTINQIAAGIEAPQGGSLALTALPTNPRFAQPYSGLYWQVTDESRGTVQRSQSLWDVQIALPNLEGTSAESQSGRAEGPAGQTLFLREKRLVIALPGGDRTVRITLAEDEADIRTLRDAFRSELVPALLILGTVLLIGAWLQVGAGLRPFASVRRGVRDIRTGARKRLSPDVPVEIGPLVEEVNTLLDTQDGLMARARDRAADLAHGLRTPLTALASDAERLKAEGHPEIAAEVSALAARMRRSVERELARARERHSDERQSVRLQEAANAIVRTLMRTPKGEHLEFDVDCTDEIALKADADDLYDVLGNLLENAVRAAATRVRISCSAEDGQWLIAVENDGAAIAPEKIKALSARGRRQDETEGAGLGLAIVSDVLAAYGSAPDFFSSPLGGLGVRFRLPRASEGG